MEILISFVLIIGAVSLGMRANEPERQAAATALSSPTNVIEGERRSDVSVCQPGENRIVVRDLSSDANDI